MANQSVVRVGVFPFVNQVMDCAVALTKLMPTRKCPDIGLGADVLGRALDVTGIPYEVVPVTFDGNFGVFDQEQGKWTGKGDEISIGDAGDDDDHHHNL